MIKIFPIRDYVYVLIIISIVLLLFYIIRWLSDFTIKQLNKVFLVVSLSLFLIPTISIINSISYKVFFDYEISLEDIDSIIKNIDIKDSYPDIYYIVVDAYTSNNVLEEYFDLYDSKLNEYLSEKGFFIANNSKSNYNVTQVSLSSVMNFNYIRNIFGNSMHEVNGFENFVSSIHNSKLIYLLKKLGYKNYEIMNMDYLFPDHMPKHIDNIFLYNSTNEYLNEIYNLTPLTYIQEISHHFNFTNLSLNSLPYDNFVDGVRWIPESTDWVADRVLKLSNSENNKKFIFAHILSPHYPFYYNQNCELTYEYIDRKKRWLNYNGDFSIYKNGYRNQVKCLNEKIIKLINSLLKNPKHKIIIIQGDHGPRISKKTLIKYGKNINPSHVQFSVLNAFYFSDGMNNSDLYQSISLVNTFRVVLNHITDANLNYLPDNSYKVRGGGQYKLVISSNQN